jgi:hypothetical protein
VKIYLLLIDSARFFFYSDESETIDDEAEGDRSITSHAGVRGWLCARYERFKAAWEHADAGALLWMRRTWDWLHSWSHPDEAMLARMWSARQIDLHYPAGRRGDQVLVIWHDYLRQQLVRHTVWLSINSFIAPVTVLFAILPGPNLIGYWFAYRAIHHLVVVWGIQRVWRNKVPTEMVATDALDLPLEQSSEGRTQHAALGGRAARLDDHVAWHISARGQRRLLKRLSAPAAAESQIADCQTEKS